MNGIEMPTSDAELEALDAFLSSEDSPPESMQISGLDGFLTGIAIGPEVIMPSEWLPVIWGGEEPTFADAAQAQGVLGAIMSRYNEIIGQVQEDGFEPILWVFDEETIIAAEWAEGFACAIGLRPRAWDPLFESKRHAHLLLPILGLCTNEDGSSALGLDAEAEDRLATEAPDMIAGCVGEIARFWRSRRNAHSRKGPGDRDSLPARAATKTGRNDPCPCGSGKKFKKCCGQTD